MIKNFRLAVPLVMALGTTSALLVGCGGGGGDAGSATTTNAATVTTAFPLQAGYRARIVAGAADNFTVSGTCAGTAMITSSTAVVSTFEGVSGFASAQTATMNLSNCTPATNAVSGTSYFDASYAPLGSSTPGLEYAKFLTAPPPIAASVKVGDTTVFATLTTYTNSGKTVPTGQRVLSYVIEPDGASTAIVNLISKAYNLSGQLLYTEQSRYRIAADGGLTAVSIDVQYSTTSTVHLVYTKA